MIQQQNYKIRKSFTIPLGLDVILLLVLLLLSIFRGETNTEKMVLAAILLPASLIFFESIFRHVITGEDGIIIRKFWRNKSFRWHEITHLGIMIMRNKSYFLLTTTKGFHVLSSAYEGYEKFIRYMAEHLDTEKVEPEVMAQLEKPAINRSDIIAAWFAAAVIMGIITLKVYPF